MKKSEFKQLIKEGIKEELANEGQASAFVISDNEGKIYGVSLSKESAEKLKIKAQSDSDMGGSHNTVSVKPAKLIKENLEQISEEPITEVTAKELGIKNDIGKFFVVTKPTGKSTLADIMFESDPIHFANQIKGGLEYDKVLGFYTNKSDASWDAKAALKDQKTQMDELQSSIKEFRKHNEDLDSKKKKAIDLIYKLKGK